MTTYYNENDPNAAAWLRELIKTGQIAPGTVDERSIEDVKPTELFGYTQCHFFAGIGGWSLALRLAGWPDDRPVWTGSCPCQPFSTAGKGTGFDDERHLWPSFQWLIQQCRPSTVFGEQVASGAVDDWFDLVQSDLEAMGYAFGIVPFPACSVGAPHIRDRAYWVADSNYQRLEGWGRMRECPNQFSAWENGLDGGMANAKSNGRREELEDAGGSATGNGAQGVASGCMPGGEAGGSDSTNGFWRVSDWLLCRDEKWRPVEPGTSPLVDGIPRGMVQGGDISFPTAEARTMRLKGYGNAIVPQQASVFIQAFL
jgi:DNA (cytosine-5)-methyltransferase 1